MKMYKGSKGNMVSIGNKLSKITLTVSLLFFGISCTTLAQQPVSERTITINMSASELLPADLIIFNVTINAEGETPQEAFDLHRERESILAGLLKDLNIREENIDFEPIQMNRRQVNGNRYNNQEPQYVTNTNQSVSITFNDFEMYERIQLTLIENDFDTFNGQFSSTKIAEGKEKALISAIEASRERAELIAQTSGVEVGDIYTINYSDHQVSIPRKVNSMEMMSMAADATMMDFAQTVEVRSNINISYFIK
ncbi:SIMPL domain-containing protein [Gracilimonas amylolytica]|uniref:SIMPL domain-containing protein n=1 Tax=Gracilimonas amylolytica TaxID=1749045 RepID=UPI001E645C3E|nr:SIMPL domain-containing protein [Gracilimonas amylolytica]